MKRTVGHRLAEYIKKNYPSTAEFCRAAGLNESIVCRLKNGSRGRHLSNDVALLISRATNGKFPPSIWVTK